MTPRFLITTADERTWPRDKPVLFLGEWCKLYNRSEVWRPLDAAVVPYHWDDRAKLQRDYRYLRGLYEELLAELAQQLNALHGVRHSLRYWRVLVGPWLTQFVSILFDRWQMIDRAASDSCVSGALVLDLPSDRTVPNDMERFMLACLEDSWNEAVFGQLLLGHTRIPIEKVQPSESAARVLLPSPSSQFARRLKQKLTVALHLGSQLLTREDDVFFLSSYLPTTQDLRLQWRLGQIPKMWRSRRPPKLPLDWGKRQWRLGTGTDDKFSSIARAMIPQHIPVLYVEGYAALKAFCGSLQWPRKPRLIFTSNAWMSDDVFKAWTAARIEDGAPLVIAQHGGNYGTGRWEFTEEHQCAVSDAWLSWGWDDASNQKIRAACNLKLVGRHQGWDPTGGALMVELIVPRYSYRMFSVAVASQWLDYFNEQCRFVAALPRRLQDHLLVRLDRQDYGWCAAERWRDRLPQIRVDDGRSPIERLIGRSRLYISTYNATTFLESLAMNIPSIIFWNPSHWELRDSARPYFDRLKTAGVFHETPESAAAKMTEIWDDVQSWWGRSEVQAARRYFCDRFSRSVEDPIRTLQETLTSTMNMKTAVQA